MVTHGKIYFNSRCVVPYLIRDMIISCTYDDPDAAGRSLINPRNIRTTF